MNRITALQKEVRSRHQQLFFGIVFIAFISLLIMLVETAWLCDDAMITFRTVLHFVHGNGLVFNLGDRVQGYTHPLWMFVLSLNYWINDEIFISTMHLGIVLSAIAFSIAVLQAQHQLINLSLICLGLIGSRAFIEYGTSGLENPLSYVLFGLLFILINQQPPQKIKPYSAIIATCSLLFLCRMDYAVICAPIAILATVRVQQIRLILTGFLLGGLPAFSWLTFSTLYYGTPFPNTYYAKLHTGIPKYQSIIQGIHYIQDLINHDFLSFIFIALSLITLIFQKNTQPHVKAFGFGLFLYCLYILNIGGDFMSGRFFAVPVYLAALILTQLKIISTVRFNLLIASVGLLLVYFIIQTSISLININPSSLVIHANGIADEREAYYQRFGLQSPVQDFPKLPEWTVNQSSSVVIPPATRTICGGLGNESLGAGPAVHFVDTCGLVDALLVRLPSGQVGKEVQDEITIFTFPMLVYRALFESVPVSWVNEFGWRIGHIERVVPEGYLETIQGGKNVIQDDEIAALYDDIKPVISGPIWSVERLKLVWNFINPQE